MIRLCLFIVVFFSACSLKEAALSSFPYHIVIKNSQIALNDTGFLLVKNHTKELQVFSAGTPILDLHVEDKKICLNTTCTNKTYFNQKFFGVRHYENILNEMLSFQPIYEGKNLKKLQNGFEQTFHAQNYDIFYKVENGRLYFKDKKNRILIKFDKLGE